MLKDNEIEKLKANWGESVNALTCYAEVKFIDPLSDWCCYVLAMNPDDDDEIACIISGFEIEVCDWSLKKLYQAYNSDGEQPLKDEEFRRVRALELYRRLMSYE